MKLGSITFLKCRQKDKIRPVNISSNKDDRMPCKKSTYSQKNFGADLMERSKVVGMTPRVSRGNIKQTFQTGCVCMSIPWLLDRFSFAWT